MAAVQGSQPKTVSKGCFKCGKTGHWSRDCSAPPSEWVARPPTQTDQSSAAVPAQPTTAEQPGQLHIPLATGKRIRKKPKLTVDHLKAERHGIAEVFHTFPQTFRQQFRGKGHEAGDLKRLLELYIGWQQRILPFSNFDAFLEALEKLGSSYVLKMELRELRSGILKVLEEPKQEDGSWFGMGAAAAASPGKQHEATASLHKMAEDDMDMPDWDDEDLLAMQAEPMVPKAPAGHAQQHAADHQADELELDDDELLELVGDLPEHPNAPQQQASGPGPLVTANVAQEDLDAFDADELQELADADMNMHNSQQQAEHAQQQPQQQTEPVRQSIATDGPPNAHQDVPKLSKNAEGTAEVPEEDVVLDDDTLIELACASMSEEASKAPGQHESNNTQCGTAAPLYDTLDDEELLALATTQLDEA